MDLYNFQYLQFVNDRKFRVMYIYVWLYPCVCVCVCVWCVEDDRDLSLVKMSLGTVLQMNTNLALVGIFDQILSEDETIREKGIQYVAGPLMDMRDKLFFRQPEKEKALLDLVKKVKISIA